MKNLTKTTINQVAVYAVFILFALATGALKTMALPTGDDIYYSSIYKAYILGDSSFPGLGPWLEFFRHHAETFNGRFGDKLLPLYMCLSPMLRAAVSALTVFATLLFASRLVFGRCAMRHAGSMAAGACLILMLPWYDTGLLSCMFINYEMGFLVCLMWVWYYVSPGILSRRNAVPLLLLGLLAGSWHEGFAVPLWAGGIIPLLMRKELRTGKHLLLMAALSGGILFTVACPGFWVRFGREFGDVTFSRTDLIVGGTLPALGIAAALIMLCRRHISWKQSHIEATYLAAYIVVVLLTAAIILKTDAHHFRAWWLADGLSVVVLLRACRLLRPGRTMRWTLLSVTVACAFVNLASSLKHQYLIYSEAQEVIAEYLKSPDGLVYHDISAPRNVSLLTLRKVQKDLYTSLYVHPRHPRASRLRVLPAEFSDPSHLRLRALPQEGGQKFSITSAGHILLHEERADGFATLSYKDGNGEIRRMRVSCRRIPDTRNEILIYVETLPYIWEGAPQIALPLEVL